MSDVRTGWSRLEWIGLIVLAMFTAASIGGYYTFALHPENLPQEGFALRLYAVSFQFFAQAHIALAVAVLAASLTLRVGLRWWPAFLGVCALSFTSEHIGTGYGIPFGGYGYTGLLGARIGPRVPALIPVSWFLMTIPAWVIARSVFQRRKARLLRVTAAALLLVLWDLALDPAMSFLTPYWVWEESGAYYGMPALNLLGWFVTGLALMAVCELFAERARLVDLSVSWMTAFFALVVLLPVGMLAAAGAWLAVVVTAVAFGVMAAVLRAAREIPAGDAARAVEAQTVNEPDLLESVSAV